MAFRPLQSNLYAPSEKVISLMHAHSSSSERRFSVREGGLADLPQLVPLFEAYRRFYGASGEAAAANAFLAARQERGEAALLVAVEILSNEGAQDVPRPAQGAIEALLSSTRRSPRFHSGRLSS